MKVPEGRTVYIKSRKYIAGEELPGGVYLEFDKQPIKKVEKKVDELNFKESE